MQRSEKETVVQEVTDVFARAKSVFVTDYAGLTVEKMSVLRQRCRAAKVEYRVVKNTLARQAAENAGQGAMQPYFKGPTAIAYTFDDPSAPARVIAAFSKEHQKPTVRGSLFEGHCYGPERVAEIAALPSRSELVSRVLGGFQAPIRGVVCGLNGILSKFVRTVDAVRESKAQASP
jgi:large subunit ribosomal protein L10